MRVMRYKRYWLSKHIVSLQVFVGSTAATTFINLFLFCILRVLGTFLDIHDDSERLYSQEL